MLDSTCVKANIDFPTDWVLLRDGVRSLMEATLLIRRAGLRVRMQPPEAFLRRMNRLSMEMTQQTRRAGQQAGPQAGASPHEAAGRGGAGPCALSLVVAGRAMGTNRLEPGADPTRRADLTSKGFLFPVPRTRHRAAPTDMDVPARLTWEESIYRPGRSRRLTTAQQFSLWKNPG